MTIIKHARSLATDASPPGFKRFFYQTCIGYHLLATPLPPDELFPISHHILDLLDEACDSDITQERDLNQDFLAKDEYAGYDHTTPT